jgi:hypothetical protein
VADGANALPHVAGRMLFGCKSVVAVDTGKAGDVQPTEVAKFYCATEMCSTGGRAVIVWLQPLDLREEAGPRLSPG